MKKILIAVLVAALLLVAGIYWFIPGTLTVSAVAVLHGTVTGTSRTLLQKENWEKFWPGEKQLTSGNSLGSNDVFTYNTDTFRITKLLRNSLEIAIANPDMQVNSVLLIAPFNSDSIVLKWSYGVHTSANPFVRVQQYRQAAGTKQHMKTALLKIKQFLNSNENVYGITINQTSTQDTLLVSTHSFVPHYPSTNDIYALIKKLQAYIEQNGAVQTGNPMLNIYQLDAQQYKIMVAVPTNKMLKEQGDIVYKRMVPGRFLTTTVTGGTGAINNAYEQMQHYFQDYRRTAMAIPFQVLVTDRTKQTDTAKWVTKLYFPVM